MNYSLTNSIVRSFSIIPNSNVILSFLIRILMLFVRFKMLS